MSKAKRRRRWTAEKKLKIVLETLQSDRKLAEICRREGLSPTQVYLWRKQLSASAEVVFGRRKHNGEERRVARLALEHQRMKNVVAEITAENLDLKKTLSD
jgi:transposase